MRNQLGFTNLNLGLSLTLNQALSREQNPQSNQMVLYSLLRQ